MQKLVQEPKGWHEALTQYRTIDTQIREQMLLPDFYLFTLKFEIPQQPIKMDQSMKFFFKCYATFQCGHYNIFKKYIYFAHENIKKCPQKLLIIDPKLVFSQVWPGCPNQPRIDFSYHKMSVTSICSLICVQIVSMMRRRRVMKNKKVKKSLHVHQSGIVRKK